MALSSPRLRDNAQLQDASNNAPPLRYGSRGEGVRLIQQGLIEQGFPLPKSTRRFGSPDGIFGSETASAVRLLQTRHHLTPDGVVGRNTMALFDRLMAAPAPPLPPLPDDAAITHRVRLHFRSLSLTDVPFDLSFATAKSMYRQYGIDIEMASGMSLGLTPDEADRFKQVDGTCDWNITSGEYFELQRLGPPVPSTDILVYYVDRFSEAGLLGCGGHAPDRPACIVAAAGSRTDTAHEVGHVLLTSQFPEVHNPDRRNLMFAFTNRNSNPVLNDAQVTQMKRSPCCHRIA